MQTYMQKTMKHSLNKIKNRCEQQKGIQAPEMISSPKV